MTKKHPLAILFLNILVIQLGAVITAVGLEEFLIPNKLLDGGVVGIAIIVSYLSQLPLGIWLVLINIPFILLSWRKIGLKFVLLTVYAVISLSLWVTLLHPVPVITSDLFLSAIFGGLSIGLGVGLILRNGGCLDGTEILAIIINKKLSFTVGEIIMFFNVFIFLAAGFVFGIDKALYSIVAYLIAYKVIDLVISGINQSHSLLIVTQKPEAVSQALMKKFSVGVTILKGVGGYSKKETDVLYLVIGRLEITKAKEIIREEDDQAFITIQSVQELITKHKTGH